MRPGQQNKRGRGRSGSNNNGGGNNRKGQNPLSRTYDSSGPDVKVRGTAQHIAEKYMNLARDAQSSGDRVMAENYLQHAEHYNRIILVAQAQLQERYQREESQIREAQDQVDDDRDEGDNSEINAGDERNDQNARAERQPRQDRNNRNERSDRNNRNGRPEREPQHEVVVQIKPAYDADAPQPVIEGVPAEVAIGQDSMVSAAVDTPVVEGEAEAEEAPRPAPRRRGRPKRVRADETGDAGKSETKKTTKVAKSAKSADEKPASSRKKPTETEPAAAD